MKHLYAPWRATYGATKSTKAECPFCPQGEGKYDAHYLVAQFTYCYILLNQFPYNPGHVLIIPYRHIAALHKLTVEERAELMEVTTRTTVVMRKLLKTTSFNIGLNIGGKAAGGSIPRHLHMHVVPRWAGDTGFLTALADTKQISANLDELQKKLSAAFKD